MRNGFSRSVSRTWVLILAAFALTAAGTTIASDSNKRRKPEKKIERVKGELVVRVKGKKGMSAVQSTDLVQRTLVAKLGKEALKSTVAFKTDTRFQLVRMTKDQDVSRAIQALESSGSIAYAEPNYVYRRQLVEASDRAPYWDGDVNDPEFEKLWGIRNSGQADSAGQVGTAGSDINVLPLWAQGHMGNRNIKVAVIDTGIEWSHPDLAGNLFTNAGESGDKAENGVDDDGNGFIDDTHGWNFVSNTRNSNDDHSHGTHCAGTIGALGNNGLGVVGVTWNVSLMPVKFLDASGGGTLAAAVESINYANMMGVQIMSNSWGGGGFSQALFDAIKATEAKGVLFVAAAGNEATDNDSTPGYPASYEVANVVSVAATDNLDKLASFSNYGKTKVHVSAPGVKIWSTVTGGGYKAFSGTSMATPHVSGIAALLMADFPQMTAVEVKDRLIRTSDFVPGIKKRSVSRGRVNAQAAYYNVDQVVSEPDPTGWKPIEKLVESPHPYELNKSYTFDIEHPGAKFIRVHFSKFSTENRYDTVTIVDSAGTEVESISGKHDDYTSEYATGSKLKITLKSDYVQADFGFIIDRIEVIE